jgi:GNAT superfamily N-acetyltransferase
MTAAHLPPAHSRDETSGLVLRLAHFDDFDALMALYRQLNPDDTDSPRPPLEDILLRILASDHLEIAVAERDGRVVATCYLNVIPNLTRGGSPYAVMENVVVEEGLRGHGVGRALVRWSLGRAWARGCYKVLLQTGSREERTHRFYAACGFSATEKFAFVARPGPLPAAR